MYKEGDKFIIEIEEVFKGKATGYPQYRIKGFDGLIMNDKGLEKLSRTDNLAIFNLDEAYNRGLNEAWEAAKKLCQSINYGGLEEYCSEIFGKKPFETFDVFDYTAPEAIAKIKAYEDKQKQDYEIKVGDEVKSFFGERGIVITNEISTEGDISVLFENRSHVQLYPKDKLTRTGRTFPQIAKVLAEFRGEEWLI